MDNSNEVLRSEDVVAVDNMSALQDKIGDIAFSIFKLRKQHGFSCKTCEANTKTLTKLGNEFVTQGYTIQAIAAVFDETIKRFIAYAENHNKDTYNGSKCSATYFCRIARRVMTELFPKGSRNSENQKVEDDCCQISMLNSGSEYARLLLSGVNDDDASKETSAVSQVMRRFIGHHGTGLALLPLETGFGKTYNATKIMEQDLMCAYSAAEIMGMDLATYLSDSSIPRNIPRRYIYITPLSKNVNGAYTEFIKHLSEQACYGRLQMAENVDDIKEKIADSVLVFKSIQDTFTDYFLLDSSYTDKEGKPQTKKVINSAAMSQIPQDVLKKGTKKQLEALLLGMHNSFNQMIRDDFANRFAEFEKQQVRQEIKNALRALKRNRRIGKQNWQNILHSKEWIWLKKLYPAAYLDDYYLIFCTTSKFLNNIDPLWTGSSRMYEATNVVNTGTVVFADEIDAQKSDFTQMVVKKATSNSIDIIGAVNSITVEIEKRELAETWAGENSHLHEIFKDLREDAKRLNEVYKFGTCHYRDRDLLRQDMATRPILFQDEYNHSLVEGGKRVVGRREQGNIIYIVTQDGEILEDEQTINIQSMLIDSLHFLDKFKGFVRDAAFVVARLKFDERKESAEEHGYVFIPESDLPGAVASVLDYFSINPELNHYFIDAELGGIGSVRKEYANEKLYERNFHQDGFQYFVLKEDRNASLRTPIQYYDVECSPEYVLLQICSKCKVIGLSATCLNTAVTARGNFNLNYIHEQIGDDHFLTLTDEEVQELNNERSSWRQTYEDKINISARIIGIDNTDVERDVYTELWSSSMGIPYSDAEDIISKLMESAPGEGTFQSNVWLFERYRNVTSCYIELLKDPSIPRGLIFENAFFNDNENGTSILKERTLYDIFRVIGNCYGDKMNVCDRFLVIKSENFNEAFREETKKIKTMKRGEGKLLLTTYQTLAEGQNLQIPIPEYLRDDSDLVCMAGNRTQSDKMDIPLVYVAGPTYVIKQPPTWIGTNSREDFEADRLAHIMDFQEMYYNGEILQKSSPDGFGKELSLDRVILRAFAPNGTRIAYGTDDLHSSRQTATKMLNQAMGRINRSDYKYRNITVLIDIKAAQKASIEEGPYTFRTPEFAMALKAIKEYKLSAGDNEADANIMRLEKHAKNRSDNAERLLQNAANRLRVGSDDEIRKKANQWAIRRQYLLENGCRTDVLPKEAGTMYVAVPGDAPFMGYQKHFSEGNAFPTYSISFSDGISPERYRVVSDKDATLETFMTDERLKQLFEENGFATSTPSRAKYVMLPPYEMALYQAAIGEQVGKWAYKEFLGIELGEVDDIRCFEFFDYQVPGTSVFVDLKNWHENSLFRPLLADKDIWIKEKADRCKAKVVMIVNAYSEEKKGVHVDRSEDGVILIRIDSLLDKNGNTFVINKEAEEKINALMVEEAIEGANDEKN